MNTFQVSLGNFCVTLPTSRWNIKVVNLRLHVLRGQYSVAAVTVRTGCGRFVAVYDSPAVNALLVKLYGMGEWDLMPRKKLLVAMTGRTSIGQIFLGDHGGRIARCLYLMDRPMAGDAVRGIRIARSYSLPMYALPEFFNLVGMTLRALGRSHLRRSCNLVVIAVARLAGSIA
jgi:hypothetical protein